MLGTVAAADSAEVVPSKPRIYSKSSIELARAWIDLMKPESISKERHVNIYDLTWITSRRATAVFNSRLLTVLPKPPSVPKPKKKAAGKSKAAAAKAKAAATPVTPAGDDDHDEPQDESESEASVLPSALEVLKRSGLDGAAAFEADEPDDGLSLEEKKAEATLECIDAAVAEAAPAAPSLPSGSVPVAVPSVPPTTPPGPAGPSAGLAGAGAGPISPPVSATETALFKWKAGFSEGNSILMSRWAAFEKLPKPKGKATTVTVTRPNTLWLCRHEGVLNLLHWLSDITLRPDSHIITTGDAQRVRPDILRRATWPTPGWDPRLPRAGWEVIHPDTGFVMVKGPKSTRDALPDWIFLCQRMWRASELHCAEEVSCYVCELGVGVLSPSALRTCCVCQLTYHAPCVDLVHSKDRKDDPIVVAKVSDPKTLPKPFRASLCRFCSKAFGLP